MRQRAEYQHFTADISIDVRSAGISEKALAFFWSEVLYNPSYPSKNAQGLRVIDYLPVNSWRKEGLEDFDQLTDAVKMEVLRLYTFLNHELTHHIDFLATPFGAAFHSFACYERILMRELAPELMEHEQIDLSRPLIDQPIMVLDLGSRMTFTDLWSPRSSVLDADRRTNLHSISDGWTQDLPSTMPLFGRNYRAVTVRDDLLTILMPGTDDVYLSVKTIMEGRALANCLRYIVTLTGSDLERARNAQLLYLNDQYPPSTETTWADYRFLLDLLAGVYEMDTIEQVIGQQGLVQSLHQIPLILACATWFALHGPDPIQRLLFALDVIHERISNGEKFSDPFDFIEAIESNLAKRLKATNRPYFHVEDVLNAHVKLLEHMRQVNSSETDHLEIQKHFEHIFATILGFLRRRLGSGYRSAFGLPTDGNPLRGLNQNDVELVLGYQPSAPVHDWFALRNKLMHELGSAADKRVRLRSHFGLLGHHYPPSFSRQAEGGYFH